MENSACRKTRLQPKERIYFGRGFNEWDAEENRLRWFLIFTKSSLFFFKSYFVLFLCVFFVLGRERHKNRAKLHI